MRPHLAILALGALLPALGCHTTVRSRPASKESSAPTISQACRAWEVVETDRVVGVVVEFDALGDDPRRFFSVRNAWHQELGLVDAVGRAWRFQPHAQEALWLGTGTVVDGAARILGTADRAELIEVRLEALRAAPPEPSEEALAQAPE